MDNHLIRIAEAEGIYVAYRPLCPAKGLLGLYVRDERGPAIILDSSLPARPRLERCIMAEELGHHFTVPTTSVFVAIPSATIRTAFRRDEVRALRWACGVLMPVDKLFGAVSQGVRTVEDLADYFDVTPWMVSACVRILPCVRCVQRPCRQCVAIAA